MRSLSLSLSFISIPYAIFFVLFALCKSVFLLFFSFFFFIVALPARLSHQPSTSMKQPKHCDKIVLKTNNSLKQQTFRYFFLSLQIIKCYFRRSLIFLFLFLVAFFLTKNSSSRKLCSSRLCFLKLRPNRITKLYFQTFFFKSCCCC